MIHTDDGDYDDDDYDDKRDGNRLVKNYTM